MCDGEYARLIRTILDSGESVQTRNSRCRRVYGVTCRFSRTPLVTLRKTAWKNAIREWEWFMSGSANINDLHPDVRHWWRPWAHPDGLVPFNYSNQFRRSYGTPVADNLYDVAERKVDQVQLLIDGVSGHPYSRRNVITTWNTADMVHPRCGITNCHGTVIQAFVSPEPDALSLVTYQRSADVICGLPHNWVQYWAFLLWLAFRAGRKVGELVWVGGDVHVYEAHEGLARRVAEAAPQPEPPELVYGPTSGDFKAYEFGLDRAYRPAVEDRAEMVV